MKRRSFIKRAGAASLVSMVTPGEMLHATRHGVEDNLEQSFINPPASSRPYTWWHWMNGNISREGITLDLEAMKRVGIGGVQCFNVGTNIPKGPVDYLGEEWLELTRHAIREAGRLGLEFDMHNCPGWSSTGGPWITPELSMQQFVWTETMVNGGQLVNTSLPKPFMKLDYYRDTFVLAFPTLADEQRQMKDSLLNVSSNHGIIDLNLLNKPNLSGGVEIRSKNAEEPGYILFEFKEPFKLRAVQVNCAPITTNTPAGIIPAPSRLILEASDNGNDFRTLTDLRRLGNNVEMPATASLNPVRAKYFRLVIPGDLYISGVQLFSSPRVLNWTAKANFPGAASSGDPLKAAAALQPFATLDMSGAFIDPGTVLDISKFMNANGELNWQAPAGNWTILRMGHTAIGKRNNAAPDSGAGLECDKYSRESYDFHFNKMFDNLLPDLKSLAMSGKAGLLLDSYEVGMQNWTKELPGEFQQRRKYNFIQYLPAMTGRIVGSPETTERFLWDLRRTHADLMAANYHGYFAELCKKHGLLAYTEPYNNGPFEQMQVGSKVNITMGEFWIRGPHFFPSVKLASSIAHVFGLRVNGNQVVGAESFTGDSVHSKWLESPYAMKSQGDFMFTKGLNRFIFHRYAHQPNPGARPGMTMGPWGFHFDRTNTWFEKGKQWLQYAARCQSLLQQGLFVADLLYLTDEELPGTDLSFLATLNPAPPKGYDYDFANSEVLFTRAKMQLGRLTMPDGMSYRVLVLPQRKSMSIELLRKLQQLVREGMVLVGPPPEQTPGLGGYVENDAELKQIVKDLWGDVNGFTITERGFSQGKVIWGQDLSTVLTKLNIPPDFEVAFNSGDAHINYIHRTIAGTEVYFLANRKRKAEDVILKFRISGKKPEIWNPDTGDMTPVEIFDISGGVTTIPLSMDPSGSVFVVFRSPAPPKFIKGIQKENNLLWSAFPARGKGRFPNVTNNFTICSWIKPETDEEFSRAYAYDRGLASHVFYPPEGETLYGRDHVACGLLAARNGLLVNERSQGTPANVLIALMPLSGWTHVALVYKAGVPMLYVNGIFVKEGKASGKIVHPGISEFYEDDISWFFEGDLSEPELFPEVLSDDRLRQMVIKGVPAPAKPFPVQLSPGKKGGLLFLENGAYTLRNNEGQSSQVQVKEVVAPVALDGPWSVIFPRDLGAPAMVALPALASLHKHPESGVKYFSGTARYTKKFEIPASALRDNKRIFLDLGRVEVIAEPILNGKPLGILWKPPYMVEVTGYMKPGENILEVDVTNQWTNRLIGDEQLPEENEYLKTERGGAIKKLPAWYTEGKPKPAGGRVTFSTWQHYSKDAPLVESGLVGPVVLRTAVQLHIKY